MTYTFWVAVAVLTALALAFLAYPLFFRSNAQQQRDRRSQNLANYRQRLGELEGEWSAGKIDQPTFDNLKDELDASLLEDTAGTGEPVQARGRSSRRGGFLVVILGVVSLPLLAFGLYERWGASDAVAQTRMIQQLEQGGAASPEQVEQLLGQLRDHLEDNPDNPDGWALLGRSSMELQRYSLASEAYRQLAAQFEGGQFDNPSMAATAWGLAAQARYLDADRQWNPAVEDAVSQALAQDEDEVNALGLRGIAAFEQADYRQAAEHWTRILKVAPDYPQYAAIANGVVNAYQAMGERPSDEVIQLLTRATRRGQEPQAAPPAGEPETAASGPAVSVRVALDENLPEPAGDTPVFVFARALEGPPMPLAAVRLTVADLPATVVLDNSSAMTEQANLASADRVVIGARVSSTGSATPAPGDLEGQSEPLSVSDEMEPVTVTIDRQRSGS